jgi:Fic family protein
MMTFRQFEARAASGGATIPTATGWSLAELGEAMGKQELFTRQSPQRLKVLREHALIESAVSSNRIEGVEVDQKRVGTLIFGQPILRDRDEEEVRGYRNALNEVHSHGAGMPVSEQTIKELHRRTRGDIWDAGQYKQKAEPIIERYADGRSRVRFMPVEAGAPTETAMAELIGRWSSSGRDRVVHPLVGLGAFALDFLCIHPFRDGNGRTSRLITLLLAYHAGMEVGRYISLERLIEQNKEQYYETLQFCSQGWHEGKHEPWRFINFMLLILKDAYREFEARVGQTAEPRGAKGELVRTAVAGFNAPFRVVDIERACPGVSRDFIRLTLRKMKAEGHLHSSGRGLAARWERITG